MGRQSGARLFIPDLATEVFIDLLQAFIRGVVGLARWGCEGHSPTQPYVRRSEQGYSAAIIRGLKSMPSAFATPAP